MTSVYSLSAKQSVSKPTGLCDKANARTLTRVWILLKLADGWDEAKIAETYTISLATVKNVAHRFAESGMERVQQNEVQQRRRQALTGQQAAHLIDFTFSPASD